MKKQAKKKAVINQRLSVRDEGGKLRAKAKTVSDRLGLNSLSAGVLYALELACGETRREVAPIDWEKETLESLRSLAVYGVEFRIRASALAEIEYRKDKALVTACNYVTDDVTRISWLSSLLAEARKHPNLLSEGDTSAAYTCFDEVQAMHDALKEILDAIPGVHDGE